MVKLVKNNITMTATCPLPGYFVKIHAFMLCVCMLWLVSDVLWVVWWVVVGGLVVGRWVLGGGGWLGGGGG